MRRGPVLVLLLLAGCSTDRDPEVTSAPLLIDLQLSDSTLSMVASEPERPCECSFGWTDVGDCREQSDAIGCTCDPWPASCLEEVTVLAGGQELAQASWDPEWWGVFLELDAAAPDQVAIRGCGAEITVPVPQQARPRVSLELVETGDEVAIARWSSDPVAASSLVILGDGFVASSCHQPGGSGDLEIPPSGSIFSVTGLAEPAVDDTELGVVRLWSGNTSQISSL
jgi:hypothetical protein